MNNIISDHELIWEKTTSSLRDVFPPETFKLWFNSTRAVSSVDNILEVEVPNKYFYEWMLKNIDHIENSLKSVVAIDKFKIKFIIRSSDDVFKPPQKYDLPEPTYHPDDETAFPSTDFNPRYTFDSFVIGSSNRFAQAASEAVANEPGKRYNPLFVYGGVGLGKTHLLHSIGHRVKHNDPRKNVHYVTCEKFTQEMIECIRKNKMTEFNKKYTNISVLLMDDIQFIEGKEKTQETFFHIFNNLYESQRQVVITSDDPPDKLKTLEERLRSRFQWGVITDIQPADFETRIAILKSKAEREHLDVPDDVLLFIAKNIKDNIRKLEGALIRIYAFSSLTGSDVTVDNTKEILKDIISDETFSAPVSIDEIQKCVAEHYHLHVKDLTGKKRSKNFVFPRHLSMYISRKLTEKSTTEIGKDFGGRDHATVMYACKIISKKLDEDHYFVKMVDKLITKIKEKI
ncbi:MAG: chromosomal replication initiator protein DnaA [Elusimicrobiota bacterium]